MAEIWLVRHGQTDWNLEGRFQGQLDVPLNDTGMDQARVLANKLADMKFCALYSSDLMRARQTAEIISSRVNLPIKFDLRLREISQGQVEGLLMSEVLLKFTDALTDRSSNPVHSRMPGGESVAEVAERVKTAIEEIACAHPLEPVLVAAHGLAIATMLCRVRGYPMESVYSHIPENATAEVIIWKPESCLNPAGALTEISAQ
ncbi:MAG: histidine phosphatase family protein [Leptolinea sp.]